MKKALLFLSAVIASHCPAQLASPNGSISPTANPNTGNVGIGTASPQTNLDVAGTVSLLGGRGNIDFTAYPLDFLKNSAKMLLGWNRSGGLGEADFIANQGSGSTGGFSFYNYSNSGVLANLFSINGSTGNASLQGKLEAKEVKVTNTPTADFVFAQGYSLPKLEDVEKFVNQNRHLPEIPSAEEMKRDGVDVGEFQIRLLQKIEELTLYIIGQDKKIEVQDRELGTLKKELEKLNKKIKRHE